MKWLLAVCICFISCGQQNEPTAGSSDTVTQTSNSDTARQIQAPAAADQLIVPGESLGKISIGTSAPDLERILGKPDASDAAMGKAWLTWNGKRDEHNNATMLNIYTTYKDSTMRQKTVQQIRTTSSYFSTAAGLHVYSSLAAIRNEFPALKKLAHYTNDGRNIIIYDEKQKGIAFEIVPAGGQQICTGIIIHKKGDPVTGVYMFLHPDMKFY